MIGSDEATVESEIEYSNDSWDRVEYKTVRMNSHGPDRVTHYTYDSYDQVLTEQRALDTVDEQTYVTNEYYGRGVLKSQTDANGNRTELRYYPTSWRLKRRVYPSKTTPGSVNESDYNEYTYDKNGNVTLERKRNTTTITNTFDNNNRLTFKNLSDNTHSGDVSYGYDLRGLTRYACFGSDSTSTCDTSGSGEMNTFDGFGNVKSRKSRMNNVMRELKYQYDLEGNRTRVTHPDGYFFEYRFDGLNRFRELRSSSTASPKSAPLRLAPSSRASLRSAFDRSAISRLAPVRVAKRNDACRNRVNEKLIGPPLMGPI